MLNVGTKVKIVEDLHYGDDYKIFVNEEMENYAEKIATITANNIQYNDRCAHTQYGYHIDIDGNEWAWTDDMFITSKYQVGDKVVVNRHCRANCTYGSNTFVDEMMEMIGETVTIKENFCGRHIDSYRIEEFGYVWTDEMFEETETKEEIPEVAHEAVELLDKEMLMKEGFDTLNLCQIYSPTDEGMETIWQEYTQNKGRTPVWGGRSVLDILSQHPDYVPEKGYIVKKAEYERTVDFSVILDVINAIKDYVAYNAQYDFYEKAELPYPWTYREIKNNLTELRSLISAYQNFDDPKRVIYKGKTYVELRKEYDKFYEINNKIHNEYAIIDDMAFTHESLGFAQAMMDLFRSIRGWVSDQKRSANTDDESAEPIRELVIDEYIEELINNFPTKKIRGIRKGQKFNKVIIKVLTELGIKDKWAGYNQQTARLSDACSPQKYIKYTIISANWIDYWRMSWGTGWCSCHNIDKKHVLPSSREGMYGDGCCSSGTESYMLDAPTVIMYTVDEKYNGSDYELEPKVQRCMFHIGERKFIMGRVYPQGKDGEEEVYRQWRQIFQTIITECMGVTNYWKTQKDREEKLKNVVSYGTHYRDYEMDYCNIAGWSWLKENADDKPSDKKIYIGHNPICPHCGEEHDYEENIQCCDQYEKMTCACCGSLIDEDEAYEVDGEWYCSDCVSYCDYHEEYERDETYEVSGYGYVCEDALCGSGDFARCEWCDAWYYLPDHPGIETENGSWFCDESCANDAGFVECTDGYWRHEDDANVHYCEECGRYVTDDEWDDDHGCCTDCVTDDDNETETEVA